MSTTDDNRRIITAIFAELEQGNPRPFADALADDVRWITQIGRASCRERV